MRTFIFLWVVCFIHIELFSQTGYYFVYFKDKQNNPYSLTNPSNFLSQRSILRRTKQNINLDSLDLPVTPNYVNELISKGLKIHFTSKWLNGAMVRVDNAYMIDTIMQLPYVKSLVYTKPLASPSSKINKFETEKNYVYGMASNQIQMLKGNFIHSMGKYGQGMLIAVLDAGFLGGDVVPQLDSLRSQNRIVLTRDFVDGNFDSYVYETHSHGTMVLATMAVIDNGQYVGTAPRASYALIRTEDGATEFIFEEYCWVAGAELADSLGADVINSSLGYTTFDDPNMNHTWNDLNGKTSVASMAATIAARKGIISCISAGNWGIDTWRKIGVPADADSVLTVGAVDAQRNYAFFSSQGYSADGRVKPDVAAQGQASATVTAGGNYTASNGTSFSSPILCGLVACLWQSLPNKTNMEIVDAIKRSASQYNTPDSLLGYGIPNFETAYYYLTGINPNQQFSFEILHTYPNPSEQILNVSYQSPVVKEITVQLAAIDGKVIDERNIVLPANKGVFRIDIKSLSTGTYFLQIKAEQYQKTISFVKLQ